MDGAPPGPIEIIWWLSQRLWVRLPVSPPFLLWFCHFEGLQTVTAKIIFHSMISVGLWTWGSPVHRTPHAVKSLRFFGNHNIESNYHLSTFLCCVSLSLLPTAPPFLVPTYSSSNLTFTNWRRTGRFSQRPSWTWSLACFTSTGQMRRMVGGAVGVGWGE